MKPEPKWCRRERCPIVSLHVEHPPLHDRRRAAADPDKLVDDGPASTAQPKIVIRRRAYAMRMGKARRVPWKKVTCAHCQIVFEVTPSATAKYCKNECVWASKRKPWK